MSKLGSKFSKSSFVIGMVMAAIVGCSHRIPPAQIVTESDPVKVQDYVWEAEYDGLEDGVVTEAEVAGVLAQARAKWPDRWEFEAMTASHYVRIGDVAQAQTSHEKARVLYMNNPAMQRGTPGTATTATILGGLVGGLVYAALADDHVVEFPAAPDRETWSPPAGVSYAKAR